MQQPDDRAGAEATAAMASENRVMELIQLNYFAFFLRSPAAVCVYVDVAAESVLSSTQSARIAN